MAKKEPEGSTANLPSAEELIAAAETQSADIDELFGIGDADEPLAGGTTSPANSGVGVDEGSSPAPAVSPVAGAASGQTATPDGGTSAAPPAQQEAQSSTPAPAAAPAGIADVDTEKLRIQSLEATVQALHTELERARANPPSQQPKPTGLAPQPGVQQPGQMTGGGNEETADLPRYTLSLPQPVAAAIMSEDEQQVVAGITHMMNSLATIVHHNVRLEMRQQIAQLQSVSSQREQLASTETAMEQARADYYNAFPAHNNPLILPLIQAETAMMAAEFPGLPWSETYRNALGTRVESKLAALRGPAQQVNAPPAQPAGMIPSGPRSETPGSELTGGELIMDTFS